MAVTSRTGPLHLFAARQGAADRLALITEFEAWDSTNPASVRAATSTFCANSGSRYTTWDPPEACPLP